MIARLTGDERIKTANARRTPGTPEPHMLKALERRGAHLAQKLVPSGKWKVGFFDCGNLVVPKNTQVKVSLGDSGTFRECAEMPVSQIQSRARLYVQAMDLQEEPKWASVTGSGALLKGEKPGIFHRVKLAELPAGWTVKPLAEVLREKAVFEAVLGRVIREVVEKAGLNLGQNFDRVVISGLLKDLIVHDEFQSLAVSKPSAVEMDAVIREFLWFFHESPRELKRIGKGLSGFSPEELELAKLAQLWFARRAVSLPKLYFDTCSTRNQIIHFGSTEDNERVFEQQKEGLRKFGIDFGTVSATREETIEILEHYKLAPLGRFVRSGTGFE